MKFIHNTMKNINKFIHLLYNKQRNLTPLETKIYNEGERLIPGVTHDLNEVIRHSSSYNFFAHIIRKDIQLKDNPYQSRNIRIVDLGCGVGHGCKTLSGIHRSEVVGIDVSQEAIDYAEMHYSSPNITYHQNDIPNYVATMVAFDYVTSRGVFEHIPNGLEVALSSSFKQRLIFDVPYNEPSSSNPHHLITGITEKDFQQFSCTELFYQDLSGVIYDYGTKPQQPNMIICVRSIDTLPKISELGIIFPFPPHKV